MFGTTEQHEGSGRRQADLWTARAQDWADVIKGWTGWGIPVYRHVLERLTVDRDTRILDVGCGAGRFSRIAADRGAAVSGLDATSAFVEIASQRVPEGDFCVGDMEALPWATDAFDVVTGFNSFFIAADMVNALREAARVARPGAGVAMTVFGRPERCQSTTVFSSLQQVMPPAGTDQTPEGPGLHEEGALEARATAAGLTVREAGYLAFAEEYPDLQTMLRGYLAAPPFVRAARAAGEEAVRAALVEVLRPLQTPSGRCRLEDEVRYLIAVAGPWRASRSNRAREPAGARSRALRAQRPRAPVLFVVSRRVIAGRPRRRAAA